MLDAKDRRAAESELIDTTVGTNQFTATTGNRGHNMVNDPDQISPYDTVPVQFTGYNYGRPGDASGTWMSRDGGTIKRKRFKDGGVTDSEILQMLKYEGRSGSRGGTGLKDYGIKITTGPKWGEKYAYLGDGDVTEADAIRFVKEEYLSKLQEFPKRIRERLADYAYNTDRDVYDLLLKTNKIISLDQIQHEPPHTNDWNTNKANILKDIKNNEDAFIKKLDITKHEVMKDWWADPNLGNDANAYEKTAKGRINMWKQIDQGKVWDNKTSSWSKPKRKVKITSLAGTSSRPTRKQNIPDDAKQWDPTSDDYNQAEVKKGDYIKESGKWYKVTGRSVSKYSGRNVEDISPHLKGTYGDTRENFGRLEQDINSNEELQKAIVKQTRAELANARPNSIGLTAAELEKARKMTPEQIIDNFMRMQKQVFAVSAQKGASEDWAEGQAWDDSRVNYERTVRGMGFTPLTPGEAVAFQASYKGLGTLQEDPKFKKTLSNYDIIPMGPDEAQATGDDPSKVSYLDSWIGDNTIGQGVRHKGIKSEIDKEEAPWEDIEGTKERKHLGPGQRDMYTPPWKQNQWESNYALYNLLNTRKGVPWQSMPDWKQAIPVFKDFRGTAADMNRMLKTQMQGLQQMSGSPGAYMAGVHKMGDPTIAGILKAQSEQFNTNVAIGNRFEENNTASYNKYAQKKSSLETGLYDKMELANENFKQEKDKKMTELMNSVINMRTNQGITAAQNAGSNDFYVDPQTGQVHKKWWNNRDIPAKSKSNESVMALAAQYKQDYGSGFTNTELINAAKADLGVASNQPGYPGTSYPGVNPSAYLHPNMRGFGYPGGQAT